MIDIVTPDRAKILRLQEEEGAYYWSAVAEILFRERGLLSVQTRAGEVSADARAVVFTRGVDAGLSARVPVDAFRFYEGPIDPVLARAEGIEIEPFAAEEIRINAHGPAEGNLHYPHEYFRGSNGDPIESKEPPLWHRSAISGQFLGGPGWHVLATASEGCSSTEWPVVVVKDGTIVCGLPLFDLAVRSVAFAPLPGRYQQKLGSQAVHHFLSRMIETIVRGSLVAGAEPIGRVGRWPVGKTAAFTIRHDFDRAVPLESMSSLLDYYEERGLKASIGFLDYRLPADILKRCVDGGHEIQLHSDVASAEEFEKALRTVEEAAGVAIKGMTVHGGSYGFLGDTHFAWAESQKLLYGERFSLSHCDLIPLPRPGDDGVPYASSVMGVRYHFSHDRGGASTWQKIISETIPAALAAGNYVILMNHPDLHRSALIDFIDRLNLDNVWLATQAEVAEWFDSTHFKANIDEELTGVVNFHAVLTKDVEITTEWSGGRISKIHGRGPRLEPDRDPLGVSMPSTFLLSDGEAPTINDAKGIGELARMVALRGGGGPENVQPGQLANFFAVVLSPGWWAPAEKLIVGESVLAQLSPEILGGIIAAIETVAGRTLAVGGAEAALRGRPNARRLGDWMLTAIRNARSDTVTLQELEYFIASGGVRAHALSKVLRQNYVGQYPILTDFGGGIGLLSHVLALDPSIGIEETMLVELLNRYADTAKNLWNGGPAMRFHCSAAEKFVPVQPTDIALFCQMMFRIPRSESHDLLRRTWDSLHPQGLLIVNELIRENVTKQYTPPLLTRDELVELLLPFGHPRLYKARNDKIISQEPVSAPAQDFNSYTFLIVQKGG